MLACLSHLSSSRCLQLLMNAAQQVSATSGACTCGFTCGFTSDCSYLCPHMHWDQDWAFGSQILLRHSSRCTPVSAKQSKNSKITWQETIKHMPGTLRQSVSSLRYSFCIVFLLQILRVKESSLLTPDLSRHQAPGQEYDRARWMQEDSTGALYDVSSSSSPCVIQNSHFVYALWLSLLDYLFIDIKGVNWIAQKAVV